MAKDNFVAAIEIRSSKIAGIVGRKVDEERMEVMAYAEDNSESFVRKGLIDNIDKAANAIRKIVEKLQQQIEKKIQRVYVGVGGQSVLSLKNEVRTVLSEEMTITQEIVDELAEKNRSYEYEGLDILDVIPLEYEIDGIKKGEAVGVPGKEIIGRYLNITARRSLRKNLEESFESAGVEIVDIMLSNLALSKTTLDDSQTKNGVALVDMGAKTTTVGVYKNGKLKYLSVIPLGGDNITKDISSLKLEDDVAEEYKCLYGDAKYVYSENDDTSITTKDGRVIKVDEFNEIVEARQEEIFVNACKQIKESKYMNDLLAGIKLTGGASKLKNAKELFEKVCAREDIEYLQKMTKEISKKPDAMCVEDSFSLLGLLFMGREDCADMEDEPEPEQQPEQENVQVQMVEDNAEEKKEENSEETDKSTALAQFEERRRREKEEADRKAEEEEKRRKAIEEERLRKAKEAEAERKAKEEEERKKKEAEEERQRKEAETLAKERSEQSVFKKVVRVMGNLFDGEGN